MIFLLFFPISHTQMHNNIPVFLALNILCNSVRIVNIIHGRDRWAIHCRHLLWKRGHCLSLLPFGITIIIIISCYYYNQGYTFTKLHARNDKIIPSTYHRQYRYIHELLPLFIHNRHDVAFYTEFYKKNSNSMLVHLFIHYCLLTFYCFCTCNFNFQLHYLNAYVHQICDDYRWCK